jgi:TolB protein
MSSFIPIGQIATRGVILQPHEAVAIVQQLIRRDALFDARPPWGPPSAETVLIGGDGSVKCLGFSATPSVMELGVLLDALLLAPSQPPQVRGGLRYVIARALHEVDAPPFDSVSELSAALERHERGHRRDVVKILRARYDTATTPAVASARAEPQPLARRWALAAALALAAFLAGYALRGSVGFQVGNGNDVRSSSSPSFTGAPSSGTAAAPLGASSESVAETPSASVADTPSMLREAPAVPVTPSRDEPRRRRAEGTRSNAERLSAPPVPPADPPPASSSPAANGATVFLPDTAAAASGTAVFLPDTATGSEGAAGRAPLGDLYVMAIANDGARNDHVRPSPDGRWVAFDSDRDGETGVYIARRDGTGVKRVSGPGRSAHPSWSPDGRQLVFLREEDQRRSVWNAWRLDVGTGTLRRLTGFSDGRVSAASWFPDGRRICYARSDLIIVHDLETSATRAFGTPVAGGFVGDPTVSPDGNHIVFRVALNGAWLLDLHNGAMRSIVSDPTAAEFAWSPDGRRVAYHSGRDGYWAVWSMASERDRSSLRP